MKEMHPGATVIGFDGDPKILGLAKKKALDGIQPGSAPSQQRTDLADAARIYTAGAALGRTVSYCRLGAGSKGTAAHRLEHWFDGYDNTSDNFLGRLPEMFAEVGFQHVQE